MRRFLALLSILSIVFAGGCGTLTPEPPTPVRLQGIVVDGETDEPIDDATVGVAGGTTALTNPDGTYHVGGLPRGVTVRVTAKKKGFRAEEVRLELPSRGGKRRVTVDFTLRKESQ